MTPAEHRAEAERLLHTAQSYSVSVPARADLLQQATVHGLLAIETRTVVHVPTTYDAEGRATTAPVVMVGGGAGGSAPKPAPRKRTAKKTTAPKETSK